MIVFQYIVQPYHEDKVAGVIYSGMRSQTKSWRMWEDKVHQRHAHLSTRRETQKPDFLKSSEHAVGLRLLHHTMWKNGEDNDGFRKSGSRGE